MDWDSIAKAYEMIQAGTVNRIDGNGWTIYRVGQTIRLDIKEA